MRATKDAGASLSALSSLRKILITVVGCHYCFSFLSGSSSFSPLSALFELASSLYLGVVCCCPQKIFNGATSQQRPLGAPSTIGGLIERGVLREANKNT